MPRKAAIKTTLLATAPHLDGINQCIRQFYCGTSYTLIPVADHEWKLVHTYTGERLNGVRVVRKRGRVRFERID